MRPSKMVFSASQDSSDCFTVYPDAGLRLKAGSVNPTADEEGGETVEKAPTGGGSAEGTEKQVEAPKQAEAPEEPVFDRSILCGQDLRRCLFICSGFIITFALLHLIGAAIYPGTASKITTAILGLIVGAYAGVLIFIAYKKKEGALKVMIFATYAVMGIIAVAMAVMLITVWVTSVASVDEGVTKKAFMNKPPATSEESYIEVKQHEDMDVKAYVLLDQELTSKKKTATGYLVAVSILNIGVLVPVWFLIRRASK